MSCLTSMPASTWDVLATSRGVSRRGTVRAGKPDTSRRRGLTVPTETKVEENFCRLHLVERNQYFCGKLRTVCVFETEQRYFNEKCYVINRPIVGRSLSVVCGVTGDRVSDVDMVTPLSLIYKIVFSSISTFEAPPHPSRWRAKPRSARILISRKQLEDRFPSMVAY